MTNQFLPKKIPQFLFTKLFSTNFLAAMNSSRSDDVTKFVCPFVCSHFVEYGAFKAFETRCFEGVVKVAQVYLFEISWVFQESFKDVSS